MLCAVAEDFARIPGVHVTTLVDDRCPAPPGHDSRRVPLASFASQAFDDCVQESDATLVIAPELCDILYECSRRVLKAGKGLLGSLPDAVRLAGDKLAMHRHWRGRKVQTP